RLLVRIARGEQLRIGEKALLERGRKDREVLVEEVTRTGRQTEERAGRVAPEPARQTAERAADAPAKSRWREPPIDTAQAVVPVGDPVAVIAEEQLVGALAGEHHLHVLGRQARDEVKGHARRERDRLVLVPDQPRR